MPDIATGWDAANNRGDWQIAPPDLLSGQDLETAILISLFTDRRADADDVLPDTTGDRRGWWGDAGSAYPIGSKLWLRMRSKLTDAVVALINNDFVTALQWIIDDGVASAIDVSVEKIDPNQVSARVVVHQPSGAAHVFSYAWVWGAIT